MSSAEKEPNHMTGELPPPHPRTLGSKLGTILQRVGVIVVLTLLGLEVGARLTFNRDLIDPVRRRESGISYAISPLAGRVPLPNQTVPLSDEITYEINDLGYRGPSFPAEKPANTQYVYVMGGSATFDLYADERADWPRLLEQRLSAANNEQIVVINGGVPAYTTFNSYGRLQAEAWQFSPDYVLVYHCWNDIKYFADVTPENSLLQHTSEPTPHTIMNQYWLKNYRNPLDRLLGMSNFYLVLRSLLLDLNTPRGLEPTIPVTPDRTVQQHALDQYRLNLMAIITFAQAIDAQPVLIQQARLPVADSTDAARQVIRYDFVGLEHEPLVEAFATCDAVMADLATTYDIPLIEETAAVTGQLSNFVDHIHLSDEGSSAIAEIVGEQMNTLMRTE